MPLDPRLQDALTGPAPLDQLRALVRRLQAQGEDQPRILELFESARRHLRASGRDAEEDTLMEAMDFLVGWCSPHVSLEPKNPASPPPKDAPPRGAAIAPYSPRVLITA